MYWSREPIATNTRVYENNQRNLLQPKYEQEWDAHAVEATAYALQVGLCPAGRRVYRISSITLDSLSYDLSFSMFTLCMSPTYPQVYLIRDGINMIQERIVEWLNAMRMHDGGFISTVVSCLHRGELYPPW